MIGTQFGTPVYGLQNPIASSGLTGNALPLGTQPYGAWQSPMSLAGLSQWGIQSQQYAHPLQHIVQLLQTIPLQLQQLQQVQQVQQQLLQQLAQIVPQQLQQLQQLQQVIQFLPQQIQQLQQQLHAHQQLGQSGVPPFLLNPQVAGPFGWPAQQGTQVM
jgi:hypothetical protein